MLSVENDPVANLLQILATISISASLWNITTSVAKHFLTKEIS